MNALLALFSGTSGPQGGSEWIKPMVYLALAFLYGQLATPSRLARPERRTVQRLWLGLSALYLLVAANCLLQADVQFVLWARELTREHHFYGWRRWFQLAAISLLVVWLASRLRTRAYRATAVSLSGSGSGLGLRLVRWGALATLMLYALRYISFHYTDTILNLRWMGLSVSGGLEASAVLVALLGTGMEHRKP